MVLYFGNQSNVYTVPLPPFIALQPYLEFILQVPFITRDCDTYAAGSAAQRECRDRFTSSDEPYATSTVLMLEDILAILGGNVFYGMPKRYYFNSWTPSANATKSRYTIQTPILKQTLMTLDSTVTGSEMPFAYYAQYLGALEAVSNTSRLLQRGFRLDYCSSYDPQFETVATFAPIRADLLITSHFEGGILAGKYSVQDFLNNPLGAFRMRTHWKLSQPWQFC